MISLPVDGELPRIVDLARRERRLVVVAPPGAGKTTRVPPALAVLGPVVVLQPRRVAARALARRIAEERGWTLGEEVGFQVRFENVSSPRTRVLVATEGILNRRLQSDPLLTAFRVVVLDEFHERSQHADLSLAFCREALSARDDLALVVMSATLDASAVSGYLGGCPVVAVEGRPHAVEIRHRPDLDPAGGCAEALREGSGHVLCFLPGAGEIRALATALGPRLPPGVEVLPLHGSLPADEQWRALAPSPLRKLVLATNVAETSLTVEGVTDVVDSGLQKVLRLHLPTGIDRLETERVGADSAAQRAGRAGRTGPGRALRLWDPRERLRERRQPELERVDLSGPLLEVIAWGADPRRFAWFEAPPAAAVERGLDLLRALGAVDERGRLTRLGDRLRHLPLHPRLGRVLLAAGGGELAAAACALLAEPHGLEPSGETAECDLVSLADRLAEAPPGVRRAARALQALGAGLSAGESLDVRRALLLGFPDRVARRRGPRSPRLVLTSGHGASLSPRSGVREAEFLLALDVTGGEREGRSEALVRLASAVEREWLPVERRERVYEFDPETGAVRGVEREWYGRLALGERPVAPDPEAAAAILRREWQARGLGEANERLLARARFAGLEIDLDSLLEAACRGHARLEERDLGPFLPAPVAAELDRLAPVELPVPSGRRARLEYRPDGSVVAAVKLQELFGLAQTPVLGPRREAVLLELLAPNGRPVQVTRDLHSFWQRGYPEVRRQLRGRYPRHPWPEDPWTAPPTARAVPRGQRR